MSPSAVHRHFRVVTTMSPLQFQKRIRLQEARSLLVARPNDVAGVGHLVGYGILMPPLGGTMMSMCVLP
jgi:AraC-like DNA-binding protein